MGDLFLPLRSREMGSNLSFRLPKWVPRLLNLVSSIKRVKLMVFFDDTFQSWKPFLIPSKKNRRRRGWFSQNIPGFFLDFQPKKDRFFARKKKTWQPTQPQLWRQTIIPNSLLNRCPSRRLPPTRRMDHPRTDGRKW